jgi:hypothetical protein
MWIFLLKSIRSEWANNILVSSARNTGAEFYLLSWMSFIIYIYIYIHVPSHEAANTEYQTAESSW